MLHKINFLLFLSKKLEENTSSTLTLRSESLDEIEDAVD